MPSAARANHHESAPIDPTLADRIRDSGERAVKVANLIPALLQQPALDIEKLESLTVLIDHCRNESAVLIHEAEDMNSPMLAETARRVEGLWSLLSRKVASRIKH